ncbi:MAG TPA: calcium/sodium antiporter [Longimicrobiales bacterium]|nr:calcium/sodium antiporter [Longimicrobiales bacterium]
MLLLIVQFILGLVGLVLGAEWLVRGSASIASAAGVRPLVIGLTIVALGTSSPELAVSVLAALEERPDVAIGNIVGSNIANLGLILGITAMIKPLAMQRIVVLREIPVMIAAALLASLIAFDGIISRWNGLVLLACFAAYTAMMLRTARVLPEIPLAEAVPHASGRPPMIKHAALAIAGLVTLVLGGRFLVNAAVAAASAMGVSELVIGLTVVAVGTSLPELATSVLAAWRGHSDLAVGNIIGSNILNIFLILGTTAVIHPVAARPEIFNLEIPIMVGFSVALLPLVYRGMRLVRWQGVILLSAYLVFVMFLIGRGTV